MRVLLMALFLCLAATAWATTINVPDTDLNIREINQAMDRASAGDTVLVSAGVYDSVRLYVTPLGNRTAIVSVKNGVTLLGRDRKDVKIDQGDAEYGILCVNVGFETVISKLTVRGGLSRGGAPFEDGDGRNLIAGVGCVDGASPIIDQVTISNGSTGIVVRSDTSPSAPTVRNVIIARGDHHGIYVYGNGETPAVIDHTTIVDNFDNGVYVFDGTVEVTNSNITHNGKNGIKSYLSSALISYCNFYWNDAESDPPENYSGVSDMTGVDGNVSVEPYYCDFTGQAGYDYHVCYASDLVALGEGGTPIGAYGGGCTNCVAPVQRVSWGTIKALFR